MKVYPLVRTVLTVGGLATDLHLLKQMFVPSILIAITGISVPIGLSFLLIPLFMSMGISKLTAFATGAALSSTSLGTTFAILSAANLTSTRVGAVLVTAAMIDDVVGLVMVRAISSLSGTVVAETIARTIGVSIGFLIITFLFSTLVKKLLKRQSFDRLQECMEEINILSTRLTISGMAASTGYAGTSMLFPTYLIGISISYISQEVAMKNCQRYAI